AGEMRFFNPFPPSQSPRHRAPTPRPAERSRAKTGRTPALRLRQERYGGQEAHRRISSAPPKRDRRLSLSPRPPAIARSDGGRHERGEGRGEEGSQYFHTFPVTAAWSADL